MNRRLGFGIALIAVLFLCWLILMKPMCGEGLTASLVTRTGWSCIPS
jgi:preprotein translocase subunit SecG